MDCAMCDDFNEYRRLAVGESVFWRVELRHRQNYLGWSFVILKRHLEDLAEVSEEEWGELLPITRKLRLALVNAFSPTRFNYVSLGNKDQHVHLQVIPRYRESVEFAGVRFEDKRWGSNYSPYDASFEILPRVRSTIRDEVVTRFLQTPL